MTKQKRGFDAVYTVKIIGGQLGEQLRGEYGDLHGRIEDREIKDALMQISDAEYGYGDMTAAIKKALPFIKDREVANSVDAAVKWMQPIIKS